jgi:hypothetical protein
MACSPPFIPLASPTRRDRRPIGGGWIHEVKFASTDVPIYSKNGHRFTDRFPTIAYALPAKAAVIDAELVAATPQAIRISTSCSPRAQHPSNSSFGPSTSCTTTAPIFASCRSRRNDASLGTARAVRFLVHHVL